MTSRLTESPPPPPPKCSEVFQVIAEWAARLRKRTLSRNNAGVLLSYGWDVAQNAGISVGLKCLSSLPLFQRNKQTHGVDGMTTFSGNSGRLRLT